MPQLTSRRSPRKNPAAIARPTRKRIPVDQANLTAEERAMLPDPDWVTEDDADAIIGRRGEREGKPIPLAKVLKRYGCRVED